MDLVLREHLPLEMVEIIMSYVHRYYMKDIRTQIKHCITWISCENEYSFLISNNINYYQVLELSLDDDDYELYYTPHKLLPP